MSRAGFEPTIPVFEVFKTICALESVATGTGSGAHLASYPVGTGGSFSGGKAAGA